MTAPERFIGRIVAGAIIVVSDDAGRVLLVRQRGGPYAGHWMAPGGSIEPGERARDAAARECVEETGLTPTDVAYVATYEERGSWEHGAFHILLVTFAARASGEPHGEDHAEWRDPHALADPHPALLRVLVDLGLRAGDPDAALERAGISLLRLDR